MASPIPWRRLLALAVGILPAAMAQICTPDRGTYYVTTQSDLDMIAAECTTINGTIVVGTNYTGSFSLPNVQNITFRISSDSFPYKPAATSMDLPDLEFLGNSLFLSAFPTLANFSAPKLKTVGSKVSFSYIQTVDLRSLEEAEAIRIGGNITSLQLDSLEYVRDYCLICNMDDCNRTITAATSLDLSLPSLQTVGSADIRGRLSSLSVPKLSTITYAMGYDDRELGLVTAGEMINISFPQLSSAGISIELEGDIASLSIPRMKDVDVFKVHSYVPLDINLPFQEVDIIDLRGNISSVQFPNLESVSAMLVESDLKLDCNSIKSTIFDATNITEYDINCQSSNSNLGSSLIVSAKAAISVVVAIVGLLTAL